MLRESQKILSLSIFRMLPIVGFLLSAQLPEIATEGLVPQGRAPTGPTGVKSPSIDQSLEARRVV